jgi:ubiquinone/menaquinone biosynthesis C-methylase UbiE
MRETAETQSRHPQVRYMAGEAAAIPLPDATADFVLMFLSFTTCRTGRRRLARSPVC